ncbi:MAG: signal recognition particle protein [Planctomycetota bacterium]|jgi:signal recognition particle subunit SRP54|nr:signal recognition particle protein [Acidimicrobiales bacterium]MDA0254269.1 signal recognition particle protein [Planctomycetota bacterium]MDA1200443.1 signal recognition particle protein [Planctomycetota bacterium]
MFESLTASLSSALNSLRGRGKLTTANMREGLEQVRTALLEADVAYDVAGEFLDRVAADAEGAKVLESLDPAQQLVGIVHKELVNLMGPVDHSLHLEPGRTTVLMLCGLQGSGKTTSSAKLAKKILATGQGVMLVAADLQRPAAIEQLKVLGAQLGVPVHTPADMPDGSATDPVAVCSAGVARARKEKISAVILDTAGRLSIDEELMQELARIDRSVGPDQAYLVVDAMTGQDAVSSAKAFNDALELDGVIMTKLDGDARGGAALSVKSVAGVPIKFIGTGEQIEALEDFHPERMAGRILGMGDVVSLVEEAQRKFDQEEMQRQEERLKAGEFTLEDFKKMLSQTRRLGPLGKVMGMIPGMGGMQEMLGNADLDKDMNRLFGIIDSMTADERRNPSRVVDQSRRRRIAAGAGVEPHEVSDLVKQFDGMASMMKGMAGLGMRERMQQVQQLQAQMTNPAARLAKPKGDTGKRLTADQRRKLKKQREKEARRRKRAGKD